MNYIFNGYYQIKEFITPIRNEIKKLFRIEYDENININDVFVHYRLGDIKNSYFCLPIEYYIEALGLLDYPSGYISSDSIDDEKCKILIRDYKLKPTILSAWDTILFGKNFKNLILSEGSFSGIIGLFSDANMVICNNRELKWSGEISDGLDEYIKLSWGYDNLFNPKNFNIK
jgi:hypothetical protein